MSMSDPIADLVTQIRNGQSAGKSQVKLPASKLKVSVCGVLEEEGYIEKSTVVKEGAKSELIVDLKYYKGKPVIDVIERVSKPGRRVYKSKEDLPVILGGLGIAVVSTSKGVMTDKKAREGGHGGEVLFVVS